MRAISVENMWRLMHIWRTLAHRLESSPEHIVGVNVVSGYLKHSPISLSGRSYLKRIFHLSCYLPGLVQRLVSCLSGWIKRVSRWE